MSFETDKMIHSTGADCVVACIKSQSAANIRYTGLVVSPNFPANYPNNAHNRLVLQADPGQVVSLTFTDIAIENHQVSISSSEFFKIPPKDMRKGLCFLHRLGREDYAGEDLRLLGAAEPDHQLGPEDDRRLPKQQKQGFTRIPSYLEFSSVRLET